MSKILRNRSARKPFCLPTELPVIMRNKSKLVLPIIPKKNYAPKTYTIEEILHRRVNSVVIQNPNIQRIIHSCSMQNIRILNRKISKKNNLLKLPNLPTQILPLQETESSDSNAKKEKKIINSISVRSLSTLSLNNNNSRRIIQSKLCVRIKSYEYLSRAGEPFDKANNNNNNSKKSEINKKKLNSDSVICNPRLISKLLGNIALFGIFDGHGDKGVIISRKIRNYIYEYFKTSTTINTSKNRDNYYTILTNAFNDANTYLKNNQTEAQEYNLTGVTCILLFYPDNNSQTIYCANAGKSKCVLFTSNKTIPLSYEHSITVKSERERIINSGGIIRKDNESGVLKFYRKEDNTQGSCFTRELGNFAWEKEGIICSPEIVECNLSREEGKIIVMGSDGFWDVMKDDEVGKTARKYYMDNDIYAACRELQDQASLKYKAAGKDSEDITVLMIYFSKENCKRF